MKESKELVKIAVAALEEKLGKDIKVLDIQKVSVIADYFIIVSGDNDRQVEALAQAAEEALYKAGYEVRAVEGAHSNSWILLDFNDVIIHVFSKESRLFYDLERIWRSGKEVNPEEL